MSSTARQWRVRWWRRYLTTGTPVRDVERIVEHADGKRLIVSVNIDPLRNAKGELVGAVNCFLDITERKRADAALEHSRLHALEQEQRLAATYEHAAIGISEIAPDGQFLRVNEAICAITGYSREHLLAIKAVYATPIPMTSIPTARVFASRSPANSNFIRLRSASSARMAA